MVYEQVTGQVHEVELALDGIEHADDVGVRVQALAVEAADEEGPDAVAAVAVGLIGGHSVHAAVRAAVVAGAVRVVGVGSAGLGRGWLGPDLEARVGAHAEDEQHAKRNYRAAAAVLTAALLLARDIGVRCEVDVVLVVVAVAAVHRVVGAPYVIRAVPAAAALGLAVPGLGPALLAAPGLLPALGVPGLGLGFGFGFVVVVVLVAVIVVVVCLFGPGILFRLAL